MKPSAFQYERPSTLQAVMALLGDGHTDTKILAGGQSLVPMMNFRLASPGRLIDINRLPGMDYVRVEGAGSGNEIAIGALARHADVKDSAIVKANCPLMHAAYEWVAHSAVRNRGTLCGNLCHCDPASEMPAIMLATGATMVLRSQRGERRVAAADFFLGMYETAARPDEMLVEVRVPVAPKGQTFGFREISMRKGDYAWTVVATLLTVQAGKITHAAIAAAGIASKALRLTAVEQAVVGQAATQATFDNAGQVAFDTVKPTGDVVTSAEYRRDLLRTLVSRTMGDATNAAARA
jgi:aerobic carbon-monoxide dehydrogenase medium subunit